MTDQPPMPPPPGDAPDENDVLANPVSGEHEASTGRTLVATSAASVTPKRVRWVWEGRVPAGTLTLGVGVGGLGKTLALVCDLAAQVTRGDAPGNLDGPRNVLVSTAEDSLEHTLVPRLIAAGADLDRVAFVELAGGKYAAAGAMTLPEDVMELQRLIEEHQAALTLVDPVMAHLSDGLDSHRDHGIRRALGPLAVVAERTDTAMLGIAHLNKRESGSLYERINGSSGLFNAARSVLLVTPDPDAAEDDDTARVLVHGKCNLGPLAPTRRFAVAERTVDSADGPIVTAGVDWGEDAPTLDAYRALIQPTGEERTATDEAAAWLRDALDGGPRPVAELKKQAGRDGIAVRTLERASRRLSVDRARDGFTGPWSWSLPLLATSSPDTNVASTANTADPVTVLETGSTCYECGTRRPIPHPPPRYAGLCLACAEAAQEASA